MSFYTGRKSPAPFMNASLAPDWKVIQEPLLVDFGEAQSSLQRGGLYNAVYPFSNLGKAASFNWNARIVLPRIYGTIGPIVNPAGDELRPQMQWGYSAVIAGDPEVWITDGDIEDMYGTLEGPDYTVAAVQDPVIHRKNGWENANAALDADPAGLVLPDLVVRKGYVSPGNPVEGFLELDSWGEWYNTETMEYASGPGLLIVDVSAYWSPMRYFAGAAEWFSRVVLQIAPGGIASIPPTDDPNWIGIGSPEYAGFPPGYVSSWDFEEVPEDVYDITPIGYKHGGWAEDGRIYIAQLKADPEVPRSEFRVLGGSWDVGLSWTQRTV
jgi:hypothetical protein